MQLYKQIQKKILIQSLNWNLVTLLSIYSLSILIPAVLGKPQIVVGSMINFLITFSTLKYGIRKTLPILILPSLTVYLTGLLFGGSTLFLLYTIPLISFSNLLYSILVSKKNTSGYFYAIVVKSSFLFLSYFLLNQFFALPSIILTSSYLQFITAFVGLLMGVNLYKVSK